MAVLPEHLINALSKLEHFNKNAFLDAHQNRKDVTAIRINPLKDLPGEIVSNNIESKVPWSDYGYYLSARPSFTFDPLFHAGCYYVQDASSMFLEQALKQLVNLSEPIKVLDLCGAPGGKSTHIASLIHPESLLITNEVIKSRVSVLTDNIIKWGSENTIVTNNDPSAFKKLPGYFDVIVVDAPCSGSGLFRKDEDAVHEWSINNVILCHQRQQRILSDVLPALKENGILIYSTCSYSEEENEHIGEWLCNEMNMEGRELNVPEQWNIVKSESGATSAVGYRFYPDKIKGEGFFLACFQKTEPEKERRFKEGINEKINSKEKDILNEWCTLDDRLLIKEHSSFFLMPQLVSIANLTLQQYLHIMYKGIHLGEIMNNKLIPSHSLALSMRVSDKVPVEELNYTMAIEYLQKKPLQISDAQQGWNIARYHKRNLGWMNVLPNRINNYYPKGLRILKQSAD